MTKLRHEDYQVCWICPLGVERTAAEAMLDEKHESLPNGPHDINVYTLGRMGQHNIAIAGLPAGNSVSTANAADHMKYTFRAMRVVLLVGIGGAAPSEDKDIRLGDIVTSYPDSAHGGVVQIDSGKSVPTSVDEDGFHLNGSLNRPPDQLLNVVNALQAKHRGLSRFEEPDFMVYLRKSIEERPRMKAEYPGVEEDRLFEPAYDHAVNESTCENCDSNRVVIRKARYSTEPQIHTGLIASANNVRIDGRTREKLRQELNIVCFESEAAGIMNNFPCLVIRGISDYADSHNNDQWQPYAALVAAAYAKEWLLTFPEVELSRLETVTGTRQVLQDQGKHDEAENMNCRAVAGYERLLGPKDLSALASVNNLAAVLRVQGKYNEAEETYRRALVGLEEVLGPNHAGTLNCCNNLAGVLHVQGKYSEAENLSRRALAGKKKVLGPKHLHTLLIFNNLALILQDQGKCSEAEEMHLRAIDGYEEVLGPKHPSTLTSCNGLARVLHHHGRYSEAEDMIRRALAGREEVLGPEHPDTLIAVRGLVTILRRQGNYAEAEKLSHRTFSKHVLEPQSKIHHGRGDDKEAREE